MKFNFNKKADFDKENLDNIWVVDMWLDNMDSKDGHDHIEFTKIGLIDFLNDEIENYNSTNGADFTTLDRNATNKEVEEVLYDLFEGKVVEIKPYNEKSANKKVRADRNGEAEEEPKEKIDVLFKFEQTADDKIDIVAWFVNEPDTCYSHFGQHSSCDPEYMASLEDADFESYEYTLKELESIGYEVNVMNSDYKQQKKASRKFTFIKKRAGEETENYITVWLYPGSGASLYGFATVADNEEEALENVADYLVEKQLHSFYMTPQEYQDFMKDFYDDLSEEELEEKMENDETVMYVDTGRGAVVYLTGFENAKIEKGINESYIDDIAIIDGSRAKSGPLSKWSNKSASKKVKASAQVMSYTRKDKDEFVVKIADKEKDITADITVKVNGNDLSFDSNYQFPQDDDETLEDFTDTAVWYLVDKGLIKFDGNNKWHNGKASLTKKADWEDDEFDYAYYINKFEKIIYPIVKQTSLPIKVGQSGKTIFVQISNKEIADKNKKQEFEQIINQILEQIRQYKPHFITFGISGDTRGIGITSAEDNEGIGFYNEKSFKASKKVKAEEDKMEFIESPTYFQPKSWTNFVKTLSPKERYMLLSRMKQDCVYYLNGHKLDKFLWAGNPKDQIECMKWLYNSFSEDKKPEWVSLEDIEKYEKEMINNNKSASIKRKASTGNFATQEGYPLIAIGDEQVYPIKSYIEDYNENNPEEPITEENMADHYEDYGDILTDLYREVTNEMETYLKNADIPYGWNITIESGYYEGAQLYVEEPDDFEYNFENDWLYDNELAYGELTPEQKAELQNATQAQFEKEKAQVIQIMHDAAKACGWLELAVAYRFSNGETGYSIVK